MVFDYLSEVIASMLPLFYSVPFVFVLFSIEFLYNRSYHHRGVLEHRQLLATCIQLVHSLYSGTLCF